MNNNQGRKRVRRAQKKSQISRILLMICMMALVAVISIGGTIAWLTDETSNVTNTFETTDLDVEIAETKNNFTIVPGLDIPKDPKVTASTDVDSYVFVKVTEENWPEAKEADGKTLKVRYDIADGWTLLTAGQGETINGVTANDKVYYCELTAGDTLNGVSVIKDDKVYVSTTLTKSEMEQITPAPVLTFKAYEIQKLKQNQEIFTALEAWNTLNPAATNP